MASPRNWKAFAWLLTLRGRLVFGLALTWLAIVALVLAMAWYLGQTMLQQSNMAHLSYESSMLADEISQQMHARINALERVASTLSVEKLCNAGGEGTGRKRCTDGVVRRSAGSRCQRGDHC